MTAIRASGAADARRCSRPAVGAAEAGALNTAGAARHAMATRVPAIRRPCRPLGLKVPEFTRIHSVGSFRARCDRHPGRARLDQGERRYEAPRYDGSVPVFLCPRCAYRETSSERNVRHQPRGCSRCGFGFSFELLEDYYASPKTALIVCDRERRILVAGHSAFAVTGYDEGDLIGHEIVERLGLAGFPDGDPAARSLEWGVRVLNVPCTLPFQRLRRRPAGDRRLLPRLRRRRWAAGGDHASVGFVPGIVGRGRDGAATAGRNGPRAQRDRPGHLGVRRAVGRRRRRGVAGGLPRRDRRRGQLDRHRRHLRPGTRRADRRAGAARARRRGDRGHQGRRRRGRPSPPSASGARPRRTTCGWPATAAWRPSAWT